MLQSVEDAGLGVGDCGSRRDIVSDVEIGVLVGSSMDDVS